MPMMAFKGCADLAAHAGQEIRLGRIGPAAAAVNASLLLFSTDELIRNISYGQYYTGSVHG